MTIDFQRKSIVYDFNKVTAKPLDFTAFHSCILLKVIFISDISNILKHH